MKINEVELIPDYNPGEKRKDPILKGKGHGVKKEIEYGDAVKLGTYKNHTIYMSDEQHAFEDATNKFFAIDNETELPTIFVSGVLRKKKNWMRFTISILQARKGNKLKADEFYRFLMLKLPLILVTYQQSYGGLKVWQKLSADPQLTVFGWKNGKAINVDPRDEMDTHATHSDAYSEPESKDVYNIALIAHRKIK